MPRRTANPRAVEANRPPQGGGKPPAEIDIKQLETLAQMHCTVQEAAAVFKCSIRTLWRYLDPEARDPSYREAWERGQHAGKASLRRLQWKHANGTGSSAVQMTIHLSKHWLGETEKAALELTGANNGPIQHEDVTKRDADEFARRMAGLAIRTVPAGSPGEPKA